MARSSVTSAFTLLLVMIYFVYEWWNGQTSPAIAFGAFLAAGYAMGASDKLQKYQRWKREWEAMEGKQPGGIFSALLNRLPRLRIVFGIVAWCFWAYFVFTEGGQPDMQIPAVLFWLTNLVVVIASVYSVVRRWRTRRRPTSRDLPTTQCLSVPSQSPTPAQAFVSLPDYCRSLMR